MPAISTISILICSDKFVRYSIGPPTGLPAMKMKPVIMLTKNAMTPSGMNFSSSLMGMPLRDAENAQIDDADGAEQHAHADEVQRLAERPHPIVRRDEVADRAA